MFPKSLYIDVTNHCNKKCSFCPMKDRYTEDIMPLGFMTLKTYIGIIKECAENVPVGMNVELHKDGEPLLHEDLWMFIHYAKSKKCHVHFATNGILLSKTMEDLVDSGLDLMTLSVIDDIPYKSIRNFMAYKGKRKPVFQVKYFGEKPDIPADVFIQRKKHNWTDDEDRKSRKPCSKLLDSAAVTWDGLYTICCVDYKRDTAVPLTTIKECYKKKQEIYNNQCPGVLKERCSHCNYWEV